MPTVKADDLVMAMQWVSDSMMDAGAYICRETGKIYWVSDDPGTMDALEEVPDDVLDEKKYVAVPGKYDLDLGNQLVYEFAEEFLPQHYDHVRGIFRRKGAYGRFKAFLEEQGLLEQWYAWSDRREVEALVEWGESNGLEIERPERQKPQTP
ncbi:MAG: UPF0158 family protein [Woeseiaceae bacterium]